MAFFKTKRCSFYDWNASDPGHKLYNKTRRDHLHWTYKDDGVEIEKCEVTKKQKTSHIRPRETVTLRNGETVSIWYQAPSIRPITLTNGSGDVIGTVMPPEEI